MRDRLRTWVAVLAVAAVAGWLAAPYLSSAAFVLDVSGSSSWIRHLLPARVLDVVTRDVQVSTRSGLVSARVYAPSSHADRTLVVFPGIHPGGIDEPRLMAFSRRLAATGMNVVSVPLPDLRAFRITSRSTDVIEDATLQVAGDPALAPSGRVGLVGVSFAGGLSLVAAGRPSLAQKLQMVVSLGGHADLPRVLTYLCTGRLPDGSVRSPEAYGLVVMLLTAIDRLVPPDQVEPLRHAVTTYLEASSLDAAERARATSLFSEARSESAGLADPARTFMQWINDQRVDALGAALLPLVESLGGDPALSPDRSAAAMAPVFLLHGIADNIIPSSETPLAAAYLGGQGNAAVSWLLTPLLTHAAVSDEVPAGEAWRLVKFWKQMLDAAQADQPLRAGS